MKQLDEDTRRTQESLRKAVHDALERKRRLGQYAVIWRDGRPQRVEADELGDLLSSAEADGPGRGPDAAP